MTHQTPRVVPADCRDPQTCVADRCLALCDSWTVLLPPRHLAESAVPLVTRPPVPTPEQLRAAADLDVHLRAEDPQTTDHPLEQLIPDGFTTPAVVDAVTEAIGRPVRHPGNRVTGDVSFLITAALLRSELRRWAYRARTGREPQR